MRNFSLAGTRHVRAIATNEPELVLLVVHPNPDDPTAPILRLALNSEDVVWHGDTYEAFSFDLDPIFDDSTGQLQEIKLRVCNIQRMLQGYLEQYGGGVGAEVELFTISAADLAGDELVYVAFEVTATDSAADWVTLTLGADSPLQRSFPKYVYRKNYCMWRYKGAECKYAGVIADCDHTLDGTNGCEVHSNTINFGGFPMIDSKGIFTATPI